MLVRTSVINCDRTVHDLMEALKDGNLRSKEAQGILERMKAFDDR